MVQAGGAGYTCSYPALSVFDDLNLTRPFHLHGEPVVSQPSCASKFLKYTMRDVWGFDGFVESDCGAVQEVFATHHFASSGAAAAAASLNLGHTDIDCGNQYNLSMQTALDSNLTTIQNIEASLARRFATLMRLGLLDPEEGQPLAKIPPSALGGGERGAELNLEAARQSVVLLKRGSLPWGTASGTIAVIGPLANSTGYLLGTYRGPICPGTQNGGGSHCQANLHNDPECHCVPTVLSALQGMGATVTYAPGVNTTDLTAKSLNDSGLIAEAVAVAKQADRVVLVLGNSLMVENEAADRIRDRFGIQNENGPGPWNHTGPDDDNGYDPDSGSSGPRHLLTGTSLPGSQEALASAILALKKPTAMALVSGEGVAIDSLLSSADAILFHAYPGGTGGTAIAESVLGRHNRFGRLTMSWMPKSFETAVRFGDFGFAATGRTYRYYSGKPLFAFGHGLSFSDHALAVTPPQSLQCDGSPLIYGVKVQTTAGPKDGDVVILAFLVPQKVIGLTEGTPLPRRQLVAARRVRKRSDGTAEVMLELDPQAMQLTNLDGTRAARDGAYEVVFASGAEGEELTSQLALSGCV